MAFGHEDHCAVEVVTPFSLSRHLLAGLMLLLLSGCSTMSGSSRDAPAAIPLEVREAFDAAMVEIKAENFTKAEEILSSVLGKSQRNPVPHINLAMVQLKLGKLAEAEKTLGAALAIEPMNPVANNELGLLYRKSGRFEEARQVYQTILGKYPNYPAANKNLGILCDLYLRDYACAHSAYQAYAAAVPDDQNARIWLADVERRLGQ